MVYHYERDRQGARTRCRLSFKQFACFLTQRRRKVGENHASSFGNNLSSTYRLVYQIIHYASITVSLRFLLILKGEDEALCARTSDLCRTERQLTCCVRSLHEPGKGLPPPSDCGSFQSARSRLRRYHLPARTGAAGAWHQCRMASRSRSDRRVPES